MSNGANYEFDYFNEFELESDEWESDELLGEVRRGGRSAYSRPARSVGRARPARRPPPRRPRPRSPYRPPSGGTHYAPATIFGEPAAPPEAEPAAGPQGSEFIRWAQTALNDVMKLNLPVDGIMSPAARRAVRDFQRGEGLPVDGIIGPETQQALMAARKRGSSAAEPAKPGGPNGEFETLFTGYHQETWQGEVSRSSKEYGAWVQQSLNKIMGSQLAVDGIIGKRTKEVIRAFQTRQGLLADGIVGSLTEAALIAAGAGRPPQTGGGTVGANTAVNTQLPRSGPGFYSYTGAARRYGQAQMIQTLQAIGLSWWTAHFSGPRIGYGDVSRQGGGVFPPHKSHQNGLDVDIRLMRNDGQEAGTRYQDASYSRALTQELVNHIINNGILRAQYIFFNDPQVTGVRPWPGHDNHLHVRFYPSAASATQPELDYSREHGFAGEYSAFEWAPEWSDELEMEGAGARPRAALRYVKEFSGPAAECTAALKRAEKTKAQALAIINAQIGAAIVMLRKAAADLQRGQRTPATKKLFLKIFRVRPEFVPTWLKTTATIKDRGDVVATRCLRVAAMLASGKIKYFCAINSTNCPDCGRASPSDYACASWGTYRVVCLGNNFWDAMRNGDTKSLLSTLMHEPFHIYYGVNVTEHRATAGKFGGIYCIVQFVFEANHRESADWSLKRCQDTAVRKELDELFEAAAPARTG